MDVVVNLILRDVAVEDLELRDDQPKDNKGETNSGDEWLALNLAMSSN
jgi:hypothetical protein